MAGKGPNTRSYGAAATAPPPSNYGGRGAYNPDSLFSGGRDWQNDDVEVTPPSFTHFMLAPNHPISFHQPPRFNISVLISSFLHDFFVLLVVLARRALTNIYILLLHECLTYVAT
jgi:hypothetical protein